MFWDPSMDDGRKKFSYLCCGCGPGRTRIKNSLAFDTPGSQLRSRTGHASIVSSFCFIALIELRSID